MILPLLFQFILLSLSAKALAQEPPLAKPNCQPKCGNVNIPFPFGIGAADCYIDSAFAIDCHSDKPILRSIRLEVIDITLDGLMRVNYPVYSNCNRSIWTANASLESTPFVFSATGNKFTGVGCNNLAFLFSEDNNDTYVGGCYSSCNKEPVNIQENGCLGIKCCQTKIPSNLKRFRASIRWLMNQDDGRECKYAFLVDKHWFEKNLTNPQDVEKLRIVPVVLEWGIFDYPFNQFVRKKSDYKSSSECVLRNTTSSSGQLSAVVNCSCRKGYKGNPYLLEGCQDIDECNDNGTSYCGKMTCKNYIGSYSCSPANTTVYTVLLGMGIGLVSLFLLIGAWRLHIIIKKRKEIKLKEKFFKRNGGLLLQQCLTSFEGSVDSSKLFKSKVLDRATDYFNMNRILGQGGQGTVYKGMLADGKIVAVKKAKVVNEGKVEEFINEVVILSQINHRNVVKLLGCCLETEVPLLVYEFIPNGTLSQYLYDQNEELLLTWDMRLRIAVEVAGAISYLHSAASSPIYHRDIKSTNILLDEKYRAKIADFGTSRSIEIDQTHVTTKVLGTFGYLDPEYFRSSQFTDKSDVYSFGVVLVELLTGQKPVSSSTSGEYKSLVEHFLISMKNDLLYDILYAEVRSFGKKEEIMATANIAKRCLNLNGKNRPTMREVALELDRIRASPKNNNALQSFEEVQYLRIQLDDVSISAGSTSNETTAPLVHLGEPPLIEEPS